MDEKDRIRLMIEVEREIADIEREQKLQQQKVLNTTKTSGLAVDEEVLQVSDKDLIGTDERTTDTEDFEAYMKKLYGKRMRAKEVQTERNICE